MKTKHKILKKLLPLALVACLTLTGCNGAKAANTTRAFNDYANELFIDIVSENSLTLNSVLSNPDEYGITEYPNTFGKVIISRHDEIFKEADKILDKLSKFKYNQLDLQEQYAYDTISWHYNNILNLQDYVLYNEYLSPTKGVQIQLPILLSEYHFNNVKDVENYLKLLNDIERYFDDICEFEVTKASTGLFMSNNSALKVMSQCKNILKDLQTSSFITSFNSGIESIEGITRNEIYEFEKRNEEIVNTRVKNAYTNLYSTISTLAKKNKKTGSMIDYAYGRDYYSLMINKNTGSNRSVKNIISILENTITLNNSQLLNLISKNKDIERIDLSTNYGINNTDDIIKTLQSKMDRYFPSIDGINYTTKMVPNELSMYLNPAFYVTSPIDNYTNNSIYINSIAQYSGNPLFTNIAHETYPGHLYQHAYFNKHNKLPIRSVLKNDGYIEGWASYITNLSYSYTEMDTAQVEISRFNDAIVLCLSARADIGVHYEGWTKTDINNYFTENNCTLNASAIDSLYNIIIDDPGDYLSYAVGYIEISRLLDTAKEEMQEDFSLKKFHKFLLDAGPTPFSSIKSHVEEELYKD